jgi:transposase
MNRILERCAGIDVHQATVMVTVHVPGKGGERQELTETFGTATHSLLTMREWLQAHGVTHVAMESTGVYWKPVYYVLEEGFTLLLVNTQHVKRVPGRKTDVRDSVWLAQLLECGLLKGSFVPPRPIRELRDLTRYRKHQVRDRSREVNRLHKVLEDAGIKLSSVASNVMGTSGRAMIEALLQGTTDPTALADLAQGKLRSKLPALREALTGRFRHHHAFLIGQILAKVDFLEETIATCSLRIEELLRPFQPTMARLMTIPGVKRLTAEVIIAETGGDMSRFPSDAHLCSWAAICPGQDESAGKRRTGKIRKGNRYLRSALIECGLGASRTKNTALQALYFRVKRHRGHKKSVVAVAHQILRIGYHIMQRETVYQELGADYFDQRHRERTVRRHIRQLEQLGYRVTLAEPVEQLG